MVTKAYMATLGYLSFDILFVNVLLFMIVAFQVGMWKQKFQVSGSVLWGLYVMHLVMATVYLIYGFSSASDSFDYYRTTMEAEEWGSLWVRGNGTEFMRMLTWPFSKLLGMSYISIMYLFSYVGFLGIVLCYLVINEQMGKLPPVIGEMSWMELIWFLPNLHFWTGSLGKGSVSIFCTGLFVFGLSRFNRRYLQMAAALLMSYFLRPHVAMVMSAGVLLGVLFSGKAVPNAIKFILVAVTAVSSYFLLQSSIELTTDQATSLNEFFEKRSAGLSEANSGIDISNYSLPLKLFTFLFRPLFFDAGGFIGIIASVENSMYLWFLVVILRDGIPNFRNWNGWFKSCFFIFFLGSIALAQISGNLGLAMRQKSQFIPLFFFLFLKALELGTATSPALQFKTTVNSLSKRL